MGFRIFAHLCYKAEIKCETENNLQIILSYTYENETLYYISLHGWFAIKYDWYLTMGAW